MDDLNCKIVLQSLWDLRRLVVRLLTRKPTGLNRYRRIWLISICVRAVIANANMERFSR